MTVYPYSDAVQAFLGTGVGQRSLSGNMRARLTLGLLAATAWVVAGCVAIRPKESPGDPQKAAEEECLNGQPNRINLVSSSPKPDPELESLLGQSREPRLASVNRSVYLTLRTLDAELRREERLAECRKPVTLQAHTQAPVQAQEGAAANSGTASSGGSIGMPKANPAMAGGGGNGATAPKIVPGSDNDVVARRLRKAAEQEPDPVLRAKLWQEYWAYRQGTAAK